MDFEEFVEETTPKLTQLAIGLVGFVVIIAVLLAVVRLVDATRSRFIRRDGLPGLVFLTPAVVLLLIGLVVPLIRTTLMSFKDSEAAGWVGLDNYHWMLTQPEALLVLRNTAVWVVLVPIVSTAVGLIYAVLVDRAALEGLIKSLIFMPMAISFVGAGIIWRFIYADRPADEPQIGLLNQFAVMLGFEPQQWLALKPWNTLFLIVILIWIQAGFAMVVLSAAIKAIPGEITEAARIDGVNPWQMFWQVTVPSIRAALTVVLVTISVGTLKVFDIVRTVTGGRNETSVIANEMVDQAFPFAERGRGAALAVVLFLFVVPIVFYQIRAMRQREAR